MLAIRQISIGGKYIRFFIENTEKCILKSSPWACEYVHVTNVVNWEKQNVYNFLTLNAN